MKSNLTLNNHPGLQLLNTRSDFTSPYPAGKIQKAADEGGCGVTGFACNIPVKGKFIHEPSVQMQKKERDERRRRDRERRREDEA